MTAMDAWERCLSVLKDRLFPQSFDTWLAPLKCIQFEPQTVTLHAPNEFTQNWVREHYIDEIRQTISRLFQTAPEIVLSAPEEVAKDSSGVKRNTDIGAAGGNGSKPSARSDTTGISDYGNGTARAHGIATTTALNADYLFDSFVVGDCNEIAYSAAHAIARQPGRTRLNPLLIYGGVGIGKTHLLQAVAQESLRSGTANNPVYVTSEQFSREFVSSLKDRETLSFSERYRTADMLLIDDVQFFEGKERMQEEFFHTFNTLHNEGKQIILASDRAPEQLDGLNERLISRMQWGLVTDIQPPDFETRMAICLKKAENGGVELDPALAECIANQVRANVRELEGVVKRVLFLVEDMHGKLTPELVESALGSMRLPCTTVKTKTRIVTVSGVLESVAEHFDIPVEQLTGKSRTQAVVVKRQLAVYLCKALTGESMRTIGKKLGGRDHTTVVHSCRKFSERLSADPSLLWEAKLIAEKLGCGDVNLEDLSCR
jgi:chromosomal replication initiator protein